MQVLHLSPQCFELWSILDLVWCLLGKHFGRTFLLCLLQQAENIWIMRCRCVCLLGFSQFHIHCGGKFVKILANQPSIHHQVDIWLLWEFAGVIKVQPVFILAKDWYMISIVWCLFVLLQNVTLLVFISTAMIGIDHTPFWIALSRQVHGLLLDVPSERCVILYLDAHWMCISLLLFGCAL